MSEQSASRTESASPAASGPASARILVWDAPVRMTHWLLALSFAGAYISAESGQWELLHRTLGYTAAGLAAFRILWGLVGTRYARFSSFVRGPAAVMRDLGTIVRGKPAHYTGHNPAGSVAILAMLLLALAAGASGWATWTGLGGEWLEEVHEVAANLMLAVVAIHIAGVLLGSWLHRENLVGAMITGYKRGRPGEAIRRSWRSIAAAVLLAVLGFWWLEWQGAPAGGDAGQQAAPDAQRGDDGDDD